MLLILKSADEVLPPFGNIGSKGLVLFQHGRVVMVSSILQTECTVDPLFPCHPPRDAGLVWQTAMRTMALQGRRIRVRGEERASSAWQADVSTFVKDINLSILNVLS